MELQEDVQSLSDTVWVDVRLGFTAATETVDIPTINSFSFTVVTSEGLKFIDIERLYTLVDTDGWSAAFNAANGRVGGFASIKNGFSSTGVLIRLQFLLTGTDNYEQLELNKFRLNSRDPDHYPSVPSVRIDLKSHSE